MKNTFRSLAAGAALAAIALASPVLAGDDQPSDGVVTVGSAYPLAETIARIRADVEAKGITWFAEIDQSALGRAAGNDVLPSTLVLFGNPALGTTFVTANQKAGLDWPVRVLVYQTAAGEVRVAYNDFDWIARRHGITDRAAQFDMATSVIRSVTSAIAAH